MDAMKALVIDDEEAARDVLTKLLLRSPVEFEWIKQGCNVREAVSLIKEFEPDVVFIDVQMPEHAGYEIASFFDEMPCELVFVTAFDNYAIKAFELSAVDYLVKPVERQRLYGALQKLQEQLKQRAAIDNYKVLMEMVRKKELGNMVITELKQGQLTKHVLALKDIIAFEAMRAYTCIHLVEGGPMTVSRNMKQMEDRLPMDAEFFRSHRSWIINVDHVKHLSTGAGALQLKNDIIAKLSKNCQAELERRLENAS